MEIQTTKPPSFLSVLPTAILLSVTGWGGLIALVLNTLPTLGPRWLFFFLTVLALTGTGLPITYFLNLRFPSNPRAESAVIVRQALWIGIFGAILVWLQLGRMLSPVGAGTVAGGLALIEALLRMREISRWRPKD